MTEPRHAHAIAGREVRHASAELRDRSHDLVSRNHRPLRMSELAVNHMQIRATHAARMNIDQQFARARHGIGHIEHLQNGSVAVENHCTHEYVS
jgi:hypothetical protein